MIRSRIRQRGPRLLAHRRGRRARILTLFGGTASTAQSRALVSITVDTLPIANALPMDLGIKKGFFSAQGIEINKRTLQSGNDIVLALANHNGEIGYLGWVPMMIASTSGIPVSAVAASEVEGTSVADNWQNILVKGDSSIRNAGRPRREDDRGQRAQGRRRGDDQGRAAQARRQPELDPAARDAVPDDARRAAQRPGRRDLDAGAVPVRRR